MNSRTSITVIALSLFAGAAGAQSTQAVEWKVSEGGNGHWYQLVITSCLWDQAKVLAEAKGGHLASLNSEAEANFLRQIGFQANVYGAWVGLTYQNGSWVWVTGEPLVSLGAFRMQLVSSSPYTALIDMHPGAAYPTSINCFWSSYTSCYFIEWDRDCNSDGVVDFGQILAGDLQDADSNGKPDCCDLGIACAVPTNLLLNGGFEAGSPLQACGIETAVAGDLVAPGWQVSVGSVDRQRSSSSCPSTGTSRYGDYFIDLFGAGLGGGAIQQVMATVPGHRYRCSFWLSGDCSSGAVAKRVRARVGNWLDQTFEHICSGTGTQAWSFHDFEFVSRGGNEVLAFMSESGGSAGGPLLDGISLVDITSGCVGDLDGDGSVNGGDIALLLLNFGDCEP